MKVNRSKNKVYAPNLGWLNPWSYPYGILYRRACKMMGIDPDNNPNYREVKDDK